MPTRILKKDIEEFVESDGDDFAFEMRVLRVCHDAKLKTSHAGTYSDPLTTKDRQYDIRAKWGEWSPGHCQIHFAVECKNLRDSLPLLINRVPRSIPESRHNVIRRKVLNVPTVKQPLPAHGLFKPGELVGKSLCVVGRKFGKGEKPGKMESDSGEAYERWGQAVSSAAGIVSDFDRELFAAEGYAAEAAFFPVLVVPDDRIWVVDYDATGQMLREPTPTSECTYFLGKSVQMPASKVFYEFSHLFIYTFSAFKSLISQLPTLENGGSSDFVNETFSLDETREGYALM